jgi:hypothetical protein
MSSHILAYEKKIFKEIKNTPEEFLPNVLQIIKVFRQSVSFKPAKDSFKQGMKEALNNETKPIDTLWDDISD